MLTAQTSDLDRVLDALESRYRNHLPQGAQDVASQAWWDHAQLLAGVGYAQRQLAVLQKQPGGADTAQLERRLKHLTNKIQSSPSPALPVSRSAAARPERLYEYLHDTLESGDASSDEEDSEEGEEAAAAAGPSALDEDNSEDELPVPAPEPRQAAAHGGEDGEGEEDEYEAAAIALGRKKASAASDVQATSSDAHTADSDAHTYPPPASASDTLLQSSRQEHDALTTELLRMASQLRSNSLSFAAALERDRRLLEAAGEQLEGNLDLMTRTRGRLGVYAKKARGMGWFTLGAILTVVMSWIGLFVVIKLT